MFWRLTLRTWNSTGNFMGPKTHFQPGWHQHRQWLTKCFIELLQLCMASPVTGNAYFWHELVTLLGLMIETRQLRISTLPLSYFLECIASPFSSVDFNSNRKRLKSWFEVFFSGSIVHLPFSECILPAQSPESAKNGSTLLPTRVASS
jgi:hypothetical protein